MSLLFVLHKMTTPLELPADAEDCVELRKIGDHVSDGRSHLFIPRLLWTKHCCEPWPWPVTDRNKERRLKMVERLTDSGLSPGN